MTSSRQHAAPAVPERPPVPEPTLAERARTLIQTVRIGTLSTHSRKQPGYPFGSLMPYAPDSQGRPVFLISSMAMHTQNLGADPRSSLLVTQPGAEDPLGAARITVLGDVQPLVPAETHAARELYLQSHENARYWIDYQDFGFYRIQPVDIYFVGGFGVMGWISAAQYAASQPDPLSASACGILQHMNDDHAGALLLLAHAAGESGAEAATMTAVDRLGFHVRLRAGDRVYGLRIAFPREVCSPQDARAVLVDMVRTAKNGR